MFYFLFVNYIFLFQHEIAIVTEEGVEIIGPLSSETNWDIAHMVRYGLGFLLIINILTQV